jgi:benzoyl-CoA reductase subunit B
LEKYGAAVVASYYSIFLGGNLGLKEDGSWGRAKTPEERGWSLKTREDAVRALAHWYIERPIFESFFMPQTKAALHLKIYREWKGNGVIIHLNRGCEGMCMGSAEVRLILLESGIPVVAYEGNMGDRRELNEAQVLDRIDSFMESLGLKKLE